MAGLSVSVPGALAEPIVVQQTAPAGGAADRIPDTATAARLAREGQRLTAEQVKALEVRLETAPDDLPARARLLGYYFATSIKVAGPEATRAARRRGHQVIGHHPEATSPRCRVHRRAGHALADAEGYGGEDARPTKFAPRSNDVRAGFSSQRSSAPIKPWPTPSNRPQLAPGDSASRLPGYIYAIRRARHHDDHNNGLPMAANRLTLQVRPPRPPSTTCERRRASGDRRGRQRPSQWRDRRQ
jgi:hypothetical protein